MYSDITLALFPPETHHVCKLGLSCQIEKKLGTWPLTQPFYFYVHIFGFRSVSISRTYPGESVAHLWSKNVHSFCEWYETTNILTCYRISTFLKHSWCFLWKNWRGGLARLKFWSLDHLQQKSSKIALCQCSPSWWKWAQRLDFLKQILQFLLKGFKQNSMN